MPPSRWPQFPQAAEVISKALLDGKKLAVWGDYDVDGITSSTLVLDVLEAHGLEALWHVPDRRSEVYGLNIPAIEELARRAAASCSPWTAASPTWRPWPAPASWA